MEPAARPVTYLRLPNWVGDVCMSLPCLDALLQAGCPLVVCARPWAEDLLAAYPLAGFVALRGGLRADAAAVRAHRRRTVRGARRGLLRPDSLSSALVFRWAGIPSAGYRDDGRALLLRWAHRKPQPRPHAVQAWYGLTRWALARWHEGPLGESPAALSWRAAAAHEAAAAEWMAAHGLQARRFVLLAPTATGLHHGRIKTWPGFGPLAQALRSDGLEVVMAPPAAEQAAACAAAPAARCLPPLGLGAFAALTRQAQLVVCNDSGVSHLAAAAHAPQLTLFGVTDPARTRPWSPTAHCLGRNGAWPSVHEVLDRVRALTHSPSPATPCPSQVASPA